MPFSFFFNCSNARAKAYQAALKQAPIEEIGLTGAPNVIADAPSMIAYGREVTRAVPVYTETLQAAVYSSRGRGYAPYNEDAAALFRDRHGRIYGAVFDQAGGLGGEVRGEGSGIAAQAFFEAAKQLALDPGEPNLSEALVKAVDQAHEQLLSRGQNEVSTAVMAVVNADEIHLVSSGDSAAMLFDVHGELQQETTKHSRMTPFGVYGLTHALGLVPEQPDTRCYHWKFPPGSWLLMGSDGLLDAELTPAELGEMLTESVSAELAVNQLVKRVLRKMLTFQAKPDNLTILAVYRPELPGLGHAGLASTALEAGHDRGQLVLIRINDLHAGFVAVALVAADPGDPHAAVRRLSVGQGKLHIELLVDAKGLLAAHAQTPEPDVDRGHRRMRTVRKPDIDRGLDPRETPVVLDGDPPRPGDLTSTASKHVLAHGARLNRV